MENKNSSFAIPSSETSKMSSKATEDKAKLLLHVCCAVCGAYLVEILKKDFEPVIFFYNPNIHPEEEYSKRKASAQKLAEVYGIEFTEGNYDTGNWFEKVKGFEKEPEGGARCPICFTMRLEKTARIAREKNIGFFTTTLAVSPYKNEATTDQLGTDIAANFQLRFVKSSDFNQTKNDIWQKTRKLAREYKFYHQKYCGCVFGRR